MIRVLLVIVSMLINPISMFADIAEDFDLTASDRDCFLDIVTKVYVNPERIFCEGEKYYLSVDQETEVLLPDLQCDLRGYFVELNPSLQNSELNELIYYRGPSKQLCPSCGTEGYIAGRCPNKDCPSKENKRKYDEERNKKKEDYKRKKEEEKKKKNKNK